MVYSVPGLPCLFTALPRQFSRNLSMFLCEAWSDFSGRTPTEKNQANSYRGSSSMSPIGGPLWEGRRERVAETSTIYTDGT